MSHKPIIHPVDGADTAVLFIHGIVGTPDHFLPFLPLVPKDHSVYSLLLEGHGGSVKDFGRASMDKWKSQVSTAVEGILSTHRRLLICAHSMGTFFAIDAAIAHPDRVAGLFLLAVPLKVHLPPATIRAQLSAALGLAKPGSAAMAIVNDSSVTLTKNLFAYLPWLPRFVELLREAGRIKKQLPALAVPESVKQK